MGRADRSERDGTRQQKITTQHTAERRRQIRTRVLTTGGAVVAVIAIVVAFVVIKANAKPPASSGVGKGPTGAALATVVSDVTGVPAATLDAVGAGSGVTGKPIPVKGTPLTSGGKPEVLYMGAEFCPFCAAERWALIVALSRFGTFSGLATIRSAVKDGAGNAEPFPDTPTWTFVHASYTSPYVTFTPVEMQTNIPDPSTGNYTTLQTPTKTQQALIGKYDAPPYVPNGYEGSIPFVDFGNKYMISGASYSPQVLAGKSWSQIAAALKDPSSPVAKAVDGTANYLTAAICTLTGNQPASACTPAVRALEAEL